MPRKCCIRKCDNVKGKLTKLNEIISFHSFPKNDDICSKWRHSIKSITGQDISDVHRVRICNAHFLESDVVKVGSKCFVKRLAVPCIFENLQHEAISMQLEPMDIVSSPNNVDIDSGVSVDEMELITFEESKVDGLVNSMAFENINEDCVEHVENMDISTADEIEFHERNFNDFDGSMPSYNFNVSVNYNDKDSDMFVDGMELGSLEEFSSPKAGTSSVTFHDEFKSQNLTKPIEADVIGLKGYSTPKRRTVRYPGDINENDEMSPRTASRNIALCKKKVVTQAKAIYKLKQTVRRQKKQIETLKQLMKSLKTKFSLSDHAVQSIESTFEDDIIQQLKEGRKAKSYCENVKSFALTLNFYSNAAYEYIRKTFGKHLPSVSTLSRWYKTVDGEPGISVEALTILKSMSDDMRKQGNTLYVALMADEMAIRKQLIWNESKKQYIGYVDYGIGIECNDTTEEATDALVFMVVPINSKGKLPLAYYLTNKFTGDEKSELLRNLLRVIDDTGAEVLSITFDGASSNIAMVELLGANFDPSNFKPYFENPYTNQRIHIFLDACHMVKLLRNNWAAKGIFYDENDQEIKWEYVEKLERLQSEKGLSLGTKLTKQHIKFHNNKMKVSLAVQIFSARVADALTYCKDMEDFKGCEATIKFIKTVNDVFDVLNSNKFNNPGYKRPLDKTNVASCNSLFSLAYKYIQGLRVEVPKKIKEEIVYVKKNIVVTGIKTGFIGLMACMTSMRSIFDRYVSNGLISYLLGYKFSQDHLETMFSVIRAKGGFNNNPNCVQFKAAFKRLLMRNQLTSSLKANCLNTQDDFLAFTKLKQNIVKNSSMQMQQQFFDEEDILDVWEDAFDETNSLALSEYAIDVVAYIAGFVERSVKRKVKCNCCLKALSEQAIFDGKLIEIKDRGGLVYPQMDIFTICKNAEKILISSELSRINFYERLSARIMQQFIGKSVFSNMGHESTEIECNHSLSLLKLVVTIYLKVRLHHIAKLHNVNSKSKFLRAKCTKLIHFVHQ